MFDMAKDVYCDVLVLVGTKSSAPGSVLDYVRVLPVAHSPAGSVLHVVEKR